MNLSLSAIIIILFAHWVGDYLFQGNKIADLKGKSLKWLAVHILIYTLTLGAFSFFLFPLTKLPGFLLMNGVLHFITDLITSRIAERYKQNPRIFFPIIGIDQFIHSATLIATTYFYFGGTVTN